MESIADNGGLSIYHAVCDVDEIENKLFNFLLMKMNG